MLFLAPWVYVCLQCVYTLYVYDHLYIQVYPLSITCITHVHCTIYILLFSHFPSIDRIAVKYLLLNKKDNPLHNFLHHYLI